MMWLTELRRERYIRSVMRKLATTRVAVLSGNNVAYENAVDTSDNNVLKALKTAEHRGWVTVVKENVVISQLDGDLDFSKLKHHVAPTHRLTEAGWNAIHRTHGWVLSTFIVSLAALAVAIFELYTRD